MIVKNEKMFLALLHAYAKMGKNERMRKLQFTGDLKLEVGFRPLSKVVAEFSSKEEEREFIQAIIDAPSFDEMVKAREKKDNYK